MTEILTIINERGFSLQDIADKIRYSTMLCLTITGSLIRGQMPSSRTETEKLFIAQGCAVMRTSRVSAYVTLSRPCLNMEASHLQQQMEQVCG